MDQRERYFDPPETFRLAFEAMQARIWTQIPCVVAAFPSASGISGMMLDAQPTINGIYRLVDGTFQYKQMPLLLDCMIQFQGGGGMTATFPIKAGDECVVYLSSRCIDAWWQQGFVPGAAMNPPSPRMHNLSDGFALVGIRSHPREITIDTENACLINDAGDTYIKVNPTTKAIAAQAPGGMTLNDVAIDSSGNTSAPENLTVGTGASGTFTTLNGLTVTVLDGIVTNIV